MKITTWNVNSLRTRLNHVTTWWDANQPDVLCLQETKVMNENFPKEAFEERGLHVYIHGQKSYNGVAFISKQPMEEVQTGFNGVDLNDQARVISGVCKGVRIYNLYIPQGENVDSPKFAFKRAFYQELQKLLEEKHTPQDPLVICGDFNIAPAAEDVDDVAKRSGKCMFTEEEHTWIKRLESWGLTDTLRELTDQAGIFTWWDYRQLAFQKGRGMRIDLMYVTEPLKEKIAGMDVFREERKKEQPSDHVPVMLVLDV